MNKAIKGLMYFVYLKIIVNSKLIISHFKERPDFDKNTFLLLAWQFPPYISGGVYRPYSIAKYAPSFGWNTYVCCHNAGFENFAGLELLNQLEYGVSFIRVNKVNGRYWFGYKDIDGGYINALKLFYKITCKVKSRPKGILVSGPPFHTFYTGYLLKKYYKCQLILDYRDEWTLCPFNFVDKNKSNIALERKLLKKADKIVFVTEGIKNLYGNKFTKEIDKNKSFVIRNGWDPKIINEDKKNDFEIANNKIVVCFTGALFNEPIKEFILLLKLMLKKHKEFEERILFKFIGSKSDSAKNILLDNDICKSVELIEPVSKRELNKMLMNADGFLLLLDDKFSRALPGKLYEYLSYKKPVLVFGESNFEAALLINELKAGFILNFNDIDEFKVSLCNLKEFSKSLEKNIKLERFLKNNTRLKMTQRIIELLQKIN